jgi:hypothetical protein
MDRYENQIRFITYPPRGLLKTAANQHANAERDGRAALDPPRRSIVAVRSKCCRGSTNRSRP